MGNKIVLKKEKLAEILFGIAVTIFIAVTIYNPYGLFSVPNNITRTMFLAVSAVTLLIVVLMPKKHKKDIAFLKSNVFLYFLLPDLLLLLFSFIATFFDHGKASIYSTTWNMFFNRIALIMFLWSIIVFLGKKAVTYFFWGCALSYLYTVFNYFMENGLISGLQKATIGSYKLPIEVHNMTYIFGYLFLYFVIIYRGSRWSRILKSVLCFVFVFLGQKRLVLLAVIIGLVAWLLLHRFQGKSRKWIVRILSLAAIGLALFYIYAIISGLLERFVNANDIDTSSRLRFYKYFSKDLPFSPFYMGRGITYTDIGMSTEPGMTALKLHAATTLHNDVLRIYIGVGMIPFILYIGYIMYSRTLSVQKRYGEKIGFYYFALTIPYFINLFASNAGLEMWCYSGYALCVLAIMVESNSERLSEGIRLQRQKAPA